MSFNNLGLNQLLLDVLEKENHKNPYPIQKQAIPVVLKGKDVLGIAPTGSSSLHLSRMATPRTTTAPPND